MSNSVLVIAAHPDDEALGCGGTMARHVRSGDTVNVLFLSKGVAARERADDSDALQRQQSAEAAGARLGVNEIVILDYPDNRMDAVDLLDIVKSVEGMLERFSPSIIYTHHGGDLNIDHQVTFKAVLTASRPLPGRSVQEIHAFEVLSSTEWNVQEAGTAFSPNLYVDITDYLETKLEALSCYESEMRPYPHPRSPEVVRAKSMVRGSESGFEFAEAFRTIRSLVS